MINPDTVPDKIKKSDVLEGIYRRLSFLVLDAAKEGRRGH